MNAALYARYSSDNQTEASIDAQIRAINEYCKQEGHTIVAEYIDRAQSATNDDRDDFTRMMADSKKKIYEVVIVHKFNRFARNRYDSAFYKRKLQEMGIRVISVTQKIDDTPESIILEGLIEAMDEYYSVNLAGEVMKGLKENAYNAKHNGGIPLLGYDVAPDKTYILNSKEAQSVQLIFDLFLQGFSYAMIADQLNAKGYLSKRGNTFTKNTVRDLLCNEKFTGTYIFNKRTRKDKTSRKFKSTDQIIRIEDAMPQIISKEKFELVQVKMSRRVTGPHAKQNNYYILTGLMKCGLCGAAYSGNSYQPGRNGKKHPVYACPEHKRTKECSGKQTIRQEIVEKYLFIEMEKLLTDQTIIELAKRTIQYIEEYTADTGNEEKQLRLSITKLESKKNKLFELFYADLIEKTDLSLQLEELNSTKLINEQRLAEIGRKSYSWVNEKTITAMLMQAKKDLHDQDVMVQRKAVEAFVREVRIFPERIDIDFNVSPNVRGKVGSGEGIRTPDTAGMNRML